MTKGKSFIEILQMLEDSESGSEEISFGDLVENLNHRGFGPLLLAPTLLTILPTGAIPGVPALSGIFICLVTGQILLGRRYPWMPKKLKEYSINQKKVSSSISRAKPYAKQIDRLIKPRLEMFSNQTIHFFVAVVCFVLSTMMIVVGFVPLMPIVLCLPVFFFAIGLSTKDGLMTIIGFVLTFTAIAFIGCAAGISCESNKFEIYRPIFIG